MKKHIIALTLGVIGFTTFSWACGCGCSGSNESNEPALQRDSTELEQTETVAYLSDLTNYWSKVEGDVCRCGGGGGDGGSTSFNSCLCVASTNDTYRYYEVTNEWAVYTVNHVTNDIVEQVTTQNYITNNVVEEISTVNYLTNNIVEEKVLNNYVTNYTTNYIHEGHVVESDLYVCDCDQSAVTTLQNSFTTLNNNVNNINNTVNNDINVRLQRVEGKAACNCGAIESCNCDPDALNNLNITVNNIDSRVTRVEGQTCNCGEVTSCNCGEVESCDCQLDEVACHCDLEGVACHCDLEEVACQCDLSQIVSCECNPQDLVDFDRRITDVEAAKCECQDLSRTFSDISNRLTNVESFGSRITQLESDIMLKVDRQSFDNLTFRVGVVENDLQTISQCHCVPSSVPAPRSINSNLAPEFTQDSDYKPGEVVLHEGQLYECTKPVLRGKSFNENAWKPTTVAAMLQEIRELSSKLINPTIQKEGIK